MSNEHIKPVVEQDQGIGEEEGLEVEREDAAEIKRPFDPARIKVSTKNFVVDQIVSRVDHGEIVLDSDFQRMRGIWNPERKSRLIESLLLRIPIPVFYVSADANETWSMVDGLQRTSTIHDYMKGQFCLQKLEYLERLEGNRYDELPRSMQRRIRETQLIVNIIEPGTPEEVMFNIFRRLNTGGMVLNGQEIRNAMHPGPARTYLKELAETEEFRQATGGSVKPDRMADRECVLRFLAFYIDPWDNYSVHDLDGYLGNTMKQINEMGQSERDRLADDFTKSMRASHAIFAEKSFRKYYHNSDRRRPVNRALFEVWSVGLARCSDDEIESLIANREKVLDRFMETLSDDLDFQSAISYSTGDSSRVKKRFQTIDLLIRECRS
jgi:hypothetical protein